MRTENNPDGEVKYYDSCVPGSFSGISGFIKNNKSSKTTKKWAMSQRTITLHKPVRLKFERRKTIVNAIDQQWQCDLCDIQNLHADNDGYKYLLVNIDVFSKFAIVYPLKNKSGQTVKNAFINSIKQRKPKTVQTDRGTEYFNRVLQSWFTRNNIKHFALHNYDVKAAVVERFLRTLKSRMWRYFTHHNTRRYIECLPKLVESYNNTFHRTIGMTPNEASKTKNESVVLQRLLKGCKLSKPKFKINDIVRVSRYRGTFDKGYLPTWSEEYYRITKIENTAPPVYVISDMQHEPLQGTFYENELQKILIDPNTTYRIEKVLKQKRGAIFVKFVGWPNKFNMWIPTNDVSRV